VEVFYSAGSECKFLLLMVVLQTLIFCLSVPLNAIGIRNVNKGVKSKEFVGKRFISFLSLVCSISAILFLTSPVMKTG